MADRTIEYMRLGEIMFAPRNPKRHALGLLAESLDEHGYTEPLLLDERTRRLVAGHGRAESLAVRRDTGSALPDGVRVADDGEWLVPVVRGWSSRDDAHAERYLLASNRLTERGGWDDQGLADLLSDLAASDALLGTGYDTDDLSLLLSEIAAQVPRPAPLSDPDAVPDPPVAPVTNTGDVWLLGPHRLLCGDSTIAADVEKVMGGGMADLVWTDPPYGVSYADKNRLLNSIGRGNRIQEPIEGDHLDAAALRELLETSFLHARAACRPGAVWFVAAPSLGPPLRVFADVLDDLRLARAMLVWVKDGFVLGRSDYHGRHEQLFYGWVPGAGHTPPPSRNQDSVWEVPRPRANTVHPTMKPVALIARAINNHTSKNDLVLDPFGGSGSTLIAAHDTGRQARLIEISSHYCDVTCRRFQTHTGIVPVLEATGESVDFGIVPVDLAED